MTSKCAQEDSSPSSAMRDSSARRTSLGVGCFGVPLEILRVHTVVFSVNAKGQRLPPETRSGGKRRVEILPNPPIAQRGGGSLGRSEVVSLSWRRRLGNRMRRSGNSTSHRLQ